MSDFFQNGEITTLQNLGYRPLEDLECELLDYSERMKIALILPALYSEFEGPAMPHIVEELKGAHYVHSVILSLDRADRIEFERVKRIMAELPMKVSVVWNDGPRIAPFLDELAAAEFPVAEQGKGRGVWQAMGLALADREVDVIATHDCDILSYSRGMLSRLVYPIVNPATNFEFSKGYYARFHGRLYGRVTRLYYTPLIRSLQQLNPRGAERYLRYMDSFRFGLSGEFAFIRSLASSVRISPTWGLEVSMLSEIFDKTTVQRVCQVEIADAFEHKHQALSKNDAGRGLMKMATDIAKSLIRVLAQSGVVLSSSFFESLLVTYLQQATRAIERYHALALINGMPYDRHSEIDAIEGFVKALKLAQDAYHVDPLGAPMLSAWVRVRAGIPDFQDRLAAAVEADNETAKLKISSAA